LKWGLGLTWIPAVIGVKPVSVIAVFKEVPVPSRLSTIVEGESLFNDGVAQFVQPDSASQFDWLTTIRGRTVCGDCRRYPGGALGYLSAGLFVRSDRSVVSY